MIPEDPNCPIGRSHAPRTAVPTLVRLLTIVFITSIWAAMASGCGSVRPRATPMADAQQAPLFALPDQDGQTVELSSLLAEGPVVLLFYRGHWCQFCRRQLGDLSRQRQQFGDIPASLIAISADAPEDIAKMRSRSGVRFPLLADPDLEVINRYGVAMEGMDIALPATFIIRPDGVIAWRHVGESIDDRPTLAELLERAQAAAQ